jgi:hypothetical protein
MRQRRTGDPTITRKPGPNGTALRQENTGLRQKVTVLEQELAQQRAMAKTAQQEGLALKALKATLTKPNGGFVFYDDETREFHDGLSRRPYPLSIPSWVPKEARPEIERMWDATLPDKDVRAALKRLVTTKDKMHDGVWEKLRDVKDVAQIIPLAMEALIMFPVLRPYPQSKWRDSDRVWIKHQHPTLGHDWRTCANWAYDLRVVLASLRDVLDPTSDEANSIGAAIRFLDALSQYFRSIYAKHLADVNRFPRIARTDDRARQRFFARFMSGEMRWVNGLPLGPPRCDVVAVLVCVAFDVEDVETDTVQEWCRSRQ